MCVFELFCRNEGFHVGDGNYKLNTIMQIDWNQKVDDPYC